MPPPPPPPPPDVLEALLDACEEGNLSAVKATIARAGGGGRGARALLAGKDADGQLAIHRATNSGDLECVRFVTENGDVGACNARDDHDMTPFHLACEGGFLDIVKYFASRPGLDRSMASSKKTSYFLAQRHGHSEVVAFLDELERREEAAAAADGGREGDAFKTPPARKKGANANANAAGTPFRRVLYTGPHTTALAMWTPILKDFARRISPPTPPFQYPPSAPFNAN